MVFRLCSVPKIHQTQSTVNMGSTLVDLESLWTATSGVSSDWKTEEAYSLEKGLSCKQQPHVTHDSVFSLGHRNDSVMTGSNMKFPRKRYQNF